MYFAVNFSQLNYTYTISLAVHLRIVNVDVPMSVSDWYLPPLSPWTLQSRWCLVGLAGQTAFTSPEQRWERAQVWAEDARSSGKACRLPAQLSPLHNRKRNVLLGPATVASQILSKTRLPETGRFHLSLKFCFQVHMRVREVGGDLIRHDHKGKWYFTCPPLSLALTHRPGLP